MFKRRFSSGFTIVELLIVIVVIGILAALVISTYSGVQARAQFAKVQTDMKAMQEALEMYKADNGSYPTTSGWSYSANSPTAFIPGLSPNYMAKLPLFTNGTTSTSNCYVYQSNGTDYKLIRVGQPSIPSAEAALVPTSMKDQYNGSDRYGVWSPGGSTI